MKGGPPAKESERLPSFSVKLDAEMLAALLRLLQ